MKKLFVLGALILTVGVGSVASYADTTAIIPASRPINRSGSISIEDRETRFKERTEYKKEQIKKAVADGLITEAEAKQWEEHFIYMENFHKENGFIPGDFGGHRQGNRRGKGMMKGNRF